MSKTVIRANTYETNSSSSHALSIPNGKFILKIGYEGARDFTGLEKVEWDTASRLNYAAAVIYDSIATPVPKIKPNQQIPKDNAFWMPKFEESEHKSEERILTETKEELKEMLPFADEIDINPDFIEGMHYMNLDFSDTMVEKIKELGVLRFILDKTVVPYIYYQGGWCAWAEEDENVK